MNYFALCKGIWIPKSWKFLLVESGIRAIFGYGILGFGIWNTVYLTLILWLFFYHSSFIYSAFFLTDIAPLYHYIDKNCACDSFSEIELA